MQLLIKGPLQVAQDTLHFSQVLEVALPYPEVQVVIQPLLISKKNPDEHVTQLVITLLVQESQLSAHLTQALLVISTK